MCWSGEASAVLATIGFAGTAYAAYKKEPVALWVSLGYFSLMEALQAFTYSVIDQCALPSNQIATLLGYLHIAFQPFFVSAASMYFIPKEVRERIQVWVYILCFIGAIITIIQLYPFDWAGQCDPRRPLCAAKLCSVSGNWHIAWDVPTNGIGNYFVENGWLFPLFIDGYLGYTFAVFLLPVLYGSWRFTIYHFLMGPLLASSLTDNVNEWPAVWCLLSIGLLLIVVKTPVRKLMFVKRWMLWPKSWTQPHKHHEKRH
jgi:hypothetical protein